MSVVTGLAYSFRRLGIAGNIGVVILVAFVATAWIAPSFLPDPNSLDAAAIRVPPGSEGHPFGTDELGRDLLARIVAAMRVAIYVSVLTGISAMTIGSLFGMVAGYYRRGAGPVIMAVADVLFAFPALLLAIILVAAIGGGLRNAVIALTIVWIPRFIRVVSSSTRGIANRFFVEAARLSRLPGPFLLGRHILPNVLGPMLVLFSLCMASAQIAYASLSFLGLGLPLPQADFGSMLSRSRTTMTIAPWLMLLPTAALSIFIVSLHLVSDGLRDLFDPEHTIQDDA